MKVKIRYCVIIIIGIIFLLYYYNTDSLINYVKSIYKGNIPHSEIVNSEFEHFDITEKSPETENVIINVVKLFSLHNFKDGYIWVNVYCHATNDAGECTYHSEGIERWKIHKENGKWEILQKRSPVNSTIFSEEFRILFEFP